jgi:crotonobetainyl-CoA:carnitine CoA-transferase CaiB-like acyl-CoA transferase
MTARSSAPLSGLRIVDMSTAWSGPMATRILASLGADVIHVESPRHLDMWRGGATAEFASRRYAGSPDLPRPYDRSVPFNSQNLDKRSLNVDVLDPEGRQVLLDLLAGADVLVSNHRAGTLDRLGLSPEVLMARNPRLVVVEMPAYGNDGPLSRAAALGPSMELESAMSAMIGRPGGPPTTTGPALLDPIGAYNGAAATLTALVARRWSGTGQHVEVPQMEAALQTVGEILLRAARTGEEPARAGNAVPTHAPHDAYACRGLQAWVAIAVRSDRQWRALARVIGRRGLAGDPRFSSAAARHRHQDELRPAIERWTSRRDKHEAERVLTQAGVPAAAVRHGRDLAEDPGLRERGMLTRLDHPAVGPSEYVGLAIRYSRSTTGPWTASPTLGQHNDELLAELHRDAAERLRLHRLGVIADVPAGSAGAERQVVAR